MSSNTLGVMLVTGGSAGIGYALVDDFLAEGYQVINIDRDPSSIQHKSLISYQLDLVNTEEVTELSKKIAEKNNVTTIVHNAGVICPSLMESVQQEDYDYVNALHVKSLIALGQAFLPAMKHAQYGRIVIISSRAVLGLKTRTSYSATKAAQLGLMRTWAMELGEYGVTVNAIAPGPVITPQLRGNIPEGDPTEGELAESLPVKRLGVPKDVSRVALFLASPDSGFITGQTWYVCGGASIGSLAL